MRNPLLLYLKIESEKKKPPEPGESNKSKGGGAIF